MHHQAKITRTDGLRPYHAQCSCSTAGDFVDKHDALIYMRSHFQNNGIVESSELIDAVIDPVAASEEESKPAPKKIGTKK